MASDEARATRDIVARGESEFDRGISFFDAIYGFAATLLIANVDAPPAALWSDLSTLLTSDVWFQLFGLALSFTVIAVLWRVNVRLTRMLKGLDSPTTVAQLVAAGLVVLLPFTTQGLSDPHTTHLALPTAMYALNVAAVSFAQTAMFEVARSRGLEIAPLPRVENRIRLADALVLPAYFLLSVPVALIWGSSAAQLSWLGLLVAGPLSAHLADRAVARSRSAGAPAPPNRKP